MKGCVIVVDMLEDVVAAGHTLPITSHARAIVPTINELCRWARRRGFPVVFACDSFLPEDLLFRSKMTPHCLRGTPGAEPVADLERAPDDELLRKRRFSAFFKTDLDQSLRTWGVDTALVCGIATPYCVLTTALDAVSHDFRAIIVEDATAANRPEVHAAVLDLYRRGPLEPLLAVRRTDDIYRAADE
ncbi:MAG: cysteine hydrolase [Deltaproteobacteria bacterium]|jgi:nicotinamidase-related amidase|nr:cysteine hydrolase [Deltaproteobacteria bacterium]MBW2533423.1 cysteine hydrolase [Deltaproteobacteria bacterium]